MKFSPSNFALVFLGGAIGTAARYAVSLTLPQLGMLFVVNLLGAAFLGLVNSAPVFEAGGSKAFWGVGFAGGFTTMSGVALWLVAATDHAIFAPFTVIAMFALGVFAYFGGLRLGKLRGEVAGKDRGDVGGKIAGKKSDAEVGE